MGRSNNGPSRRSFLTGIGAFGGLIGFDLSLAWARPKFVGAQIDPSLVSAIKFSISNVVREGLNDFLPPPFETSLLGERADLRRAVLTKAYEILESWEFRADDFSKLDLIEYPKRQYGARRICAIMQPLDTIVYLALALLVSPAIEKGRIAADEGIVHSYRYRPSRLQGRVFDRRFTFASFLRAAQLRGADRRVTVSCDIANFYGSVSASAVSTALAEAGVSASTCAFVASLLQFWSGPEHSGLPVGSHASRILAEAVLSRIDRSLRDADIEFVRYVDDFRIIGPDRETAEHHVHLFAALLAEHGFALNAEKTRVIERGDTLRDLVELASEDVKNPYQGSLPRNFRRPSARELAVMARSPKPDPAVFLAGPLLPTDKVRRAIRVAICMGQSDFVDAIPAILVRYPEFARYVTLALSYGGGFLSERSRTIIGRQAALAVLDERTPVFVRLDLLQLIAEQPYLQRDTLLAYAHASSPRGPEFRAALDGLERSGGIPASIVSRYDAADQWARRAMARTPGPYVPDRARVDPFSFA